MSQQTIMSVTEWQKANRYTVNSSKEKEMKAYAKYYHRKKSKGMWTDEDMMKCWQQGYSNGLLYDMSDDIVGEKPSFSEWLTSYKQGKK